MHRKAVRNRGWAVAGLALAALVAAALAAWSLNFGLPFLFRPDEDVMVGRAVRMAVEGTLDPAFANYPPLAFDLFALLERAAALAGAGTLVDPRRGDPSDAYLAARAVSAAASVATVVLTGLSARRWFGDLAGAFAALALAVAPLAVRQAHFATADGLQTALVAGALLAAAGQRWIAAGALCGLAAATKYTGALALVPVLVLAGRARWRAPVVAAAAAFAIPSAVMLLHPLDYLRGLFFLGGRGFATGFGAPIGLLYHPAVTLPLGLGIGAYGLGLAGVILAARRRSRPEVALLALLAGYLLATGLSREDFFRYMLPVLPVLAILAGRALAAVPRWRPAAAAVAVLLLAPSVWASVQTDRLLGTPDSRLLMAARIEATVPAGAAIDCPYYACPFYSDRQVTANERWVSDPLAASWLQGRYTGRYDIEAPNPGWKVVVAGRPPGVYDPIDAFYLPIWPLTGVARPGPYLELVENR
jgi:hypothetical protein